MKFIASLTTLALIAALTGCGGHEKTYATDVVDKAEQAAIANSPQAEPITFDDDGQPMPEGTVTARTQGQSVPTNNDSNATDTQNQETTETTENKEADKTSQENSDTATSETTTSDNKTETSGQ